MFIKSHHRVIAAVAILNIFASVAHASGDSIQMLPPVTEATKSLTTPTPCPIGSASSVLTWDGQTAIACANGITASGGNIAASGTIKPGSFTAGSSCPQEGTLGYDINNHTPVYCNGSVWTPMGAPIPCTVGAGGDYWAAGGTMVPERGTPQDYWMHTYGNVNLPVDTSDDMHFHCVNGVVVDIINGAPLGSAGFSSGN
jgi:hypothetical protein